MSSLVHRSPVAVASRLARTLVTALCGVLTSSVSYASVDFGPPTSYATGAAPNAVAVGDLNGDSRPDLVTANVNGNSLSVLRGTGGGVFGAKSDFGTLLAPLSVAIGDLDRDGRLDLVSANSAGSSASALLNLGAATFGGETDYPAGAIPASVALGDVNRDGILDAVVANRSGPSVSVLLGTGFGGFGAKTDYTVGGVPRGVLIADVTRYGLPDIITANSGSNTISVLSGNGSGGFASKVDFSTGMGPWGIAVGDLDRNGTLDVVTSNSGASTLSVLYGKGTQAVAFDPKVDYPTGSSPRSIALGDVDDDGWLDVVTGNYLSSDLSVLIGNTTGGFLPRVDLPAGTTPTSVAIADLSGDARPDIVNTNFGSNNLMVRLNAYEGTAAGKFCDLDSVDVGQDPQSIAIGDLNRDGRADLVTPNANSSDLTVWLGTNGGQFTTRINVSGAVTMRAAKIADMNRDATPDLVVIDNNQVSIRTGNGDGTFQARLGHTAGSLPVDLGIGDFDRDGLPDVAVVCRGSQTVAVFIAPGPGVLGSHTDYVTGSNPYRIQVGDYNRDGNLDLAVTCLGGGVSVFLGIGDGTFTPRTDYGAGAQPTAIASGDLDGDGILDLVTTSTTTSVIHVLLGTGTGSFVQGETVNAPVLGNVALADLDDDGRLDLVIPRAASGLVQFAPGTGAGTFGGFRDLPPGGYPYWVGAADLDRDDHADLAVLCSGSNKIHVMLNGCADVRIDDSEGAEGDVGTTPLQLMARLERPSTHVVTVHWATFDSTATSSDNDYMPASGDLMFLPGVKDLPVSVEVVGDTAPEAYERFGVRLSNPDRAVITDAVGLGTIATDDGLVSVDAGVTGFALMPLSPNPCVGRATIVFSMAIESRARLSIHDVAGREIARLADGVLAAGRHEMHWNAGADARPGVFFARFDGGGRAFVRRFTLEP